MCVGICTERNALGVVKRWQLESVVYHVPGNTDHIKVKIGTIRYFPIGLLLSCVHTRCIQ